MSEGQRVIDDNDLGEPREKATEWAGELQGEILHFREWLYSASPDFQAVGSV